MSNYRLFDLSSEPDEGQAFSKNISAFKGVFLGGQTIESFEGLVNPVNWLYEYNPVTGILTVKREDGKSNTVVIFENKLGLQTISVVFDRQMQIVVTYIKGSKCYIYYWDALEDKYIETELEGKYVKATLSTHYTLHTAFSEVVVGYVKNDKVLCIRLQRDRYKVEYIIKTFKNKIKLASISYTDKNRFQYEVMESMA